MHQYVHLAMGTEDWKLLSPAEQARIKEGRATFVRTLITRSHLMRGSYVDGKM